jgi:exo-beta-1,3-glucanase (GH17 family)
MNSSISGGSLGPPSITVGHHYAATGEDMALARYSQPVDPDWQVIDPNSIADDGDNGLDYNSQQKRASVLSFGRSSDRGSASNGSGGTPAAVVGAGAVAGGLLAGGLKSTGSGEAIPLTGPYGASSAQLSGGGGDDLGYPSAAEKREWAEKEAHGKKRRMWIIIGVLALIIIGAVAGSVAGVLLKNNNDDSPGTGKAAGGGQSADEDTSDNGDLGKDSAEIKKLLGNPNLHKVFPGIDYTPMYTQYPDCLGYPPSQNNVTRDIAIISQMTNVVRLYGTDCNQTEMTLHAIDRLGLKGKMKVWLGVWQDKNATTNARQLKQMYSILDTYGPDPFLGAIVGNEVIFREDLTVAELITELATVKSNFSALGYDLPVATSDLGDKWTAELARTSDLVMANVHPFFTGMPVADAAEFTWQFWQNKNWALNPDLGKNYIAETGWPTKGGTNCGQEGVTACEGGSVAGVAELNEFMEQWVCPALANGTNYFWFEAFDEPWKIKYNEPGKEWEDQWGILDVNRNIKKGVTIPDCGGKTVPDL